MDFKGATRLFQDPEFDGEPVTVYEPAPDEPILPPDERVGSAAQAARKQAIIEALQDEGLPLEVLTQAVPNGDELDAFDLIAHVAFDQPPLSRRERAEQVRKRNYFGQYGDQARAVLEALLDKYADHGIAGIEDPEILQLPPFDRLGGKSHIRRGVFEDPEQFSAALTELERQLYKESA
jgi:type I restriction enzyme R subunit